MTTKRQHLVWRKYLSPWTDDPSSTEGHIYYYDKVKKEIRQNICITDVGVQRYTYDISMINDNDKKVISLYFDKWLNSQTPIHLQSRIVNSNDIFNKDYIENNFIGPIEDKGISILDNLYKLKFPFDGPTLLESVTELIKYNILNSLITDDVLFSEDELLALSNYALSKNTDTDNRYMFYEFISVQMLRTWRSKESIINSINDTIKKYSSSCLNATSEAMFPLMMIVNSEILATAFCKNNFYIEIIKNKTSTNFISGDLPIINLFADYKKIKESINKMELYYPITPKLAIICKNSLKNNNTIEIDDSSKIKELNKKIYYAASKQVYAKCEADLIEYIDQQ